MFQKLIKNHWQIILPQILTILVFIIFAGKFGDSVVDSYRELYIPQQMLQGKALYKDIFVIYPPFAYIINAFVLKIFGNINSLIFTGLFATLGILFYTYKNAEIFLKKPYPLGICLFIISSLVLSPNVFNSFLPYSFGILYGILFTLISINFALKEKYPLSYLFCSFAVLCKYEFFLLLPLLIFWSKKIDWQKNIFAFITPLLLTCIILFLQGISLDSIRTEIDIIYTMSQAKTLHWFYSVMGLSFRSDHIPIYIINFIKFLIPIIWVRFQEIIIWAFPTILLLGIFRFKKLDTKERFFILVTLLISVKVFFALTLQSYGVYFIPFAITSLFILLPDKTKKIFFIFILIWTLIIAGLNAKALWGKNNDFNKVIEYIKTNTQENDRVVVYPECLKINVLSGRKSDNKFYSLIPLYVETFDEKIIIKRLNITKPEYIVINNYDTSSYYFKEFGVDYAQKIQEEIKKNYKLETSIKDKYDFKIYKLKNN